MEKLGFEQRWINLILNCITSVSYLILLNRAATTPIIPTRGLRQGDPLSPYLFLIYAEALICLLYQAEARGSITSIPIGSDPIRVNHLFLTDDSLLFCKTNSLEWSRMIYLLEIYEKASGKMVNKDKTTIFFSRNTPTKVQKIILSIVGVKASRSFEKYLGLLAMIGRSKVAAFHSLIDRTWHRITNWKTKWLSAAGKEVLLKAVLQAIPTYSMGIFLLSISISKRLNQLMRKFQQSFNEDHSKTHWLKWEKLTKGKDQGGPGLRDLRSFNLALLTKQSWRIIQKAPLLPKFSNKNTSLIRIFQQQTWDRALLIHGEVSSVGKS